ncbi:MAG: hypothetical protein MJ252_00325 [archaeon]|nr:hypothetical protein [archaeon]
MRKFEQTAELIRQNISVIRSQAEQEIKVINSTGIAEGYKIKQLAKAQAVNNTINAENAVYQAVQTQLQLYGKDFSEYVFLNSVSDKKDAKLLIGLNNSIINFPASNPQTTPVQQPSTTPTYIPTQPGA